MDIAQEGELLKMDSEEKLQTVYSNPVLVPPRKPPDTVKDFYDDQTYGRKKGWVYGRVWMWFQWSI